MGTFYVTIVCETPVSKPRSWYIINSVLDTIERTRPSLKFQRSTCCGEAQRPQNVDGLLLPKHQSSVPKRSLSATIIQEKSEYRLLARQDESDLDKSRSKISCNWADDINELLDRKAAEGLSFKTYRTLIELLSLHFLLHDEAVSLERAIRKTLEPVAYGGSELLPSPSDGVSSDCPFLSQVIENFEFHLEALNSVDMLGATNPSGVLRATPLTRPMGVIEKILTHHAVGLDSAQVTPGQMICVSVEWVLTSELLWGGMEKTYNQMKRPRPNRNDRVWLAVDHTVDPRTAHLPKQQALIKRAEEFRREAKMINYLPANTSIMHTDFTREKAQPGTIVVGSDSHTCSSGSMGSFAVGFGAADTVLPLVTGETWFRVPEVCRINFVGSLAPYVTGKDVIMHILGLFKRNTIAFQRAVEYGGEGLAQLSMDARFAIANMTTEFGGMGACFEADGTTASWICERRKVEDRDGGLYFAADHDAVYAEVRTIDLSEVEVTVALHPNPDDIVPISTRSGMKIDGCFIGACTTTEEELILAALVLEAGLRIGMRPSEYGTRRVTPGSLIIIDRLRKLGLLDVYEDAGFQVGAPGCSYCVGINDVDVAGSGEVWLSSQNRNFRNRMGQGSIGHVTCAAAVAASSFNMEVMDPKLLLQSIDMRRYKKMLWKSTEIEHRRFSRQEPKPKLLESSIAHEPALALESQMGEKLFSSVIESRVQRFGRNVDTDAIIPANFMPGKDNAELGSHCFEYFRPEFRQKVASGARIVVAEAGFGSGSSREDAVRALLGAGVECVIAKSFAFIYERNQLNMGLYNIVIGDEKFYQLAVEGEELSIDRVRQVISVKGSQHFFPFSHEPIQKTLLEAGGVLPLYHRHGRSVFRQIIGSSKSRAWQKQRSADGKAMPTSLAKGIQADIRW